MGRLDDGQGAVRRRMLDLLAARSDAAERSCLPDHFTGSALVVDADGRRVLLLLHRKLQRWLQPGGHADGDTNLASVALREAAEETGIDGLGIAVPPIDLDIHRVDLPDGSHHVHHDVRFLVVAPAGAVAVGNHESDALRWVAPEAVGTLTDEAGIARLLGAGLHRLGELRGGTGGSLSPRRPAWRTTTWR